MPHTIWAPSDTAIAGINSGLLFGGRLLYEPSAPLCYKDGMKTTIYTHESGLAHDTGEGHPEQPARLETLQALFKEAPFKDIPRGMCPAATEEQLLRAHPLSYINHIREAIPADGVVALDSDTNVSAGSYIAALHASGAVCQAIDDVMTGKTLRAFCANRPPGHHAEPTKPMGFCLFNHIFIGARHAQDMHDVNRVAIVDFDVHHGNGSDVMARAHDGSILSISTHQFPLWPMSGEEEFNEECAMNFTLPEGAGSDAFRTLYEQKVFPALHQFKPELLMISAGFDAHRDDPLAGLNLTEGDFDWVTRELSAIADRYAGGRIISVLEGGYNLVSLKSSAAAHLNALTQTS